MTGVFIKFIKISRSQTNLSRDIVSPWIETGTTTTGRAVCSSCNRNHNEGSDVSDTSAPLISRTPSSICPASPTHQDIMLDNPDWLDDVDGLPVICCDVQMRVQQIIVEHKVLEAAVISFIASFTKISLIIYPTTYYRTKTSRFVKSFKVMIAS